jgi:hypothetical protein
MLVHLRVNSVMVALDHHRTPAHSHMRILYVLVKFQIMMWKEDSQSRAELIEAGEAAETSQQENLTTLAFHFHMRSPSSQICQSHSPIAKHLQPLSSQLCPSLLHPAFC